MIDRQQFTLTPDSFGTAMPVIGGQITEDETWSPYIQASVEVPTPPTASSNFVNLDPASAGAPRYATITAVQDFNGDQLIAKISTQFTTGKLSDFSTFMGLLTGTKLAGLTYWGVTDTSDQKWNPSNAVDDGITWRRVARTFDLLVLEAEDTHEGTMTVTLASPEVLLQQHAMSGPWNAAIDGGGPNPHTLVDLVRSVINYVFGAPQTYDTWQFDADLSDLFTTILPGVDRLIWQSGQSAWDFIQTYIQTLGLRLWCDGKRVWHLDAPPATATGQLRVGVPPTGMLKTWRRLRSRMGDWYSNVVTLLGNPGKLTPAVVPFYSASLGTDIRTLVVDYTDQPQATGPIGTARQQSAPYPILSRVSQLAATLEFTSVNELDAKPGMAVQISANHPAGHVQSVSWDIQSATMTVKQR